MRKHRNQKQDQIFLKFMERNHDCATGHKNDRVAVTKAWNKLAVLLNSAGPPTKSVDEWRRAWKDWKVYVRKKILRNKFESRATGGGPCKFETISEMENRIAVLTNLYDGIEGGNASWSSTSHHNKENVCKVEAVAHKSPEKPPSPKRLRLGDRTNPLPTTASINTLVAEENATLKDMVKELRTLNHQTGAIVAMGAQLTEIMKETLDERKKFNTIMNNILQKWNEK